MPNRILRDWTQSDKIDILSSDAERFFIRLIMKADDYGYFYADTRLLKANLFALKLDTVREADISRWMAECQKAGLIVLYEVNQKKYLQIFDFRQRLDKARAKFPIRPKNNESVEVVTEFPAEAETETEVETEAEAEKTPPAILKSNLFREPVIPTKNEVLETFVQNGGTKQMAKSFYERNEATGWYFKGSPVINFRSQVASFVENWNKNEKTTERPNSPPLKRANHV